MDFEVSYIVLPACTNLFFALALVDHFADIILTYEQFEERAEEVVIHMQVVVRI